MPKPSRHRIIWSEEHQHYQLHAPGTVQRFFGKDDEQAWQEWLSLHVSFSFQGQHGHISVVKEIRRQGTGYWYAYSAHGRRPQKHYLGKNGAVTFSRLEEVVRTRTHSFLSSVPQQIAFASEVVHSPQTSAAGLAELAYAPSMPSGMPLLAAKLSRPRLPATLVEREALYRRLEHAPSSSLMLLSAAAGWGKTTLLSAWAAHSSQTIAWLSLDELDNDPARFWSALITALRVCHPALGARALAMLRAPQAPPLSSILLTLLQDLAGLARKTVLVLDDYHQINDQIIHESLLSFLEHLPDALSLVLATRADPPLALARLRVRGQLQEIRATDLRFHLEEAAQFLHKATEIPLSENEVRLLEERTEGWIAGLHLAALALQQRADHGVFVQAFRGSHRYLLDYVQEDILARQPVAVQDFVLQSAVLTRLNASACQAVTAAASSQESQELLERVERSNLFLVPLDEERRWYRFHDLFREALLARLRTTQPELLPVLHQRAAAWYEKHHELREAIAHLLACEDYSAAACLMEQAAEEVWLRGEAQTLYTWIMELPDAVVHEHARLALTCALYLFNSASATAEARRVSTREQTEVLMARVEKVLQQRDHATRSSPDVALLHQRLHVLRSWIEAFEAILTIGDAERLRLIVRTSIPSGEDEDDVLWQLIPLGSRFILHHTFGDEGKMLVERLQQMKQRVSQEKNRIALIKVMKWLALSYVDAGQLHQAYQEAQAAQVRLQHIEGHAMLSAYFALCQCRVLYQWNRLTEGRALLQQIIQEATAWQQIDVLRSGYFHLVEYALAVQDLHTAQQALQEAELLFQQKLAAIGTPWSAALRVRYWLATGDVVQASAWASQVVFDPHHAEEVLMLVRVQCAQRQYAQAIETLERFRVQLDRPDDLLHTIEFLVLSLLALFAVGDSSQARTVAARLFALTQPEGFLRVYLDEGEPMRQALLALLACSGEQGQASVPLPLTYPWSRGYRQRTRSGYWR